MPHEQLLLYLSGQDGGVRVSVLYFPDCPNWREAGARVRAALDRAGLSAVNVEFVMVDSDAAAVATGFAGSPTFMVDGVDLFGGDSVPAGLTCRVYRTESGGLAGLPDVTDLSAALRKKVVS